MPGLDLLRALAILQVVHQHGWAHIRPYFPHWVERLLLADGVNLFFVLSGFLIGGILLDMLAAEGASGSAIRRFWMRRWLRTLPCYYLVLGLLFGAALLNWIAPPPRLRMYILFVQNFAWPHPPFFGEAWSLSIEEWFYLLTPIGLWGACRLAPRADRRILLVICALVMIAVSTAYRAALPVPAEVFANGFWDASLRKVVLGRLDAIGYGVLGACLARLYPQHWRGGARGLLMLGVALLAMDRILWASASQHLFYVNNICLALMPVAVLMILPAASAWRGAPLPGWLLAAVGFISRISYPMYLIHHMLVLLMLMPWLFGPRMFHNGNATGWLYYGAFFGITIVLAWLMHRCWELPFMRLRDRFFPNPSHATAAAPVNPAAAG